MTKEEIYDEKIAPLMSQIIETCRESGISIVATFNLDEETEDALDKCDYCTTVFNIHKNDPMSNDLVNVISRYMV